MHQCNISIFIVIDHQRLPDTVALLHDQPVDYGIWILHVKSVAITICQSMHQCNTDAIALSINHAIGESIRIRFTTADAVFND